MDLLLESRLSQESKDMRRLIWLLEMKKGTDKNSELRLSFNLKRDKQIIILKDKGLEYSELCDKARQYGCGWEMHQ